MQKYKKKELTQLSKYLCISEKITTFEPGKVKQVLILFCSDGGMVDTQDLKSCDHNGCAGSSPAPSTQGDFLIFLSESPLFLFS